MIEDILYKYNYKAIGRVVEFWSSIIVVVDG